VATSNINNELKALAPHLCDPSNRVTGRSVLTTLEVSNILGVAGAVDKFWLYQK